MFEVSRPEGPGRIITLGSGDCSIFLANSFQIIEAPRSAPAEYRKCRSELTIFHVPVRVQVCTGHVEGVELFLLILLLLLQLILLVYLLVATILLCLHC